jgi:LysR family transcriptional regulator, regulator for bpeEF and oprC
VTWPTSIIELETFLAVAELRSFSRAAERLRLTQPAVTGRIKRLEAALGVRLIERTSRRLSLTGDGERSREGAERGPSGVAGAFLRLRCREPW